MYIKLKEGLFVSKGVTGSKSTMGHITCSHVVAFFSKKGLREMVQFG